MKRSLINVLIIGLLLTLASFTGETPNVPDNSGDTPSTDTPSTPEDNLIYGDSTTHPYLAINEDGSIYCIDKTVTEAEIPHYFNNIKVTEVGFEAFKECTSLTKVIIPNSVTSIEKWAFLRCSSL